MCEEGSKAIPFRSNSSTCHYNTYINTKYIKQLRKCTYLLASVDYIDEYIHAAAYG